MRPFYPALLTAAIDAQVEILPLAIIGSGKVMPRGGGFLFRPATVEVRIGAPIPTCGLEADDREALARKAWEVVNGLRIGKLSCA
jgi:1-acyl-sn-glycerol-3-phosphate acyltransferase